MKASMLRCAIIGCGPVAVYTLKHLLDSEVRSLDITMFEASPTPGKGMPYDPKWNGTDVMANIASLEIPPLKQSLYQWLCARTDAALGAYGIARTEIGERAFYPRHVLGGYFADQLQLLISQAKRKGHRVTLAASTWVHDIDQGEDNVRLQFTKKDGAPEQALFSKVVIATGHSWPQEQSANGYYKAPWPITKFQGLALSEVGIRGSSLTAIDTAITLALQQGMFESTEAGLRYVPHPGTAPFHMTMLSRKGVLPEADFYFPMPYAPTMQFTAAATKALIDNHQPGDMPTLLEQFFTLFKAEITESDPEFAAEHHLSTASIEQFCEQYFRERITGDAWEFARRDLAKAKRNCESCHIEQWRYAILRMNDLFSALCPSLGAEDLQHFHRTLKPVFVDNYATIPHRSIERILALHEAGVLDVKATGSDYSLAKNEDGPGATLRLPDGHEHAFPLFIDAIGQKPLSAKHFPFNSLREQGFVQDATVAYDSRDVARQEHVARRPGEPERLHITAESAGYKPGGIAVDARLRLIGKDGVVPRITCAAIPFLLAQRPFIQGIGSANDLGQIVAQDIAQFYAQDKVKLDSEARRLQVSQPGFY